MKHFKLILLILFLSTLSLSAATYVADTCSNADVITAIALADTGDIVTVPAGECTWSTQVVLAKEITLQGAGIGETIITNAYPTNYSGLVSVETSSNTATSTRITGFTFVSDISNDLQDHIRVSGDENYRIDHCKFLDGHDTMSNSIGIRGYATAGVIDNCIFDHESIEMINVKASDDTWADDPTLGTAAATYIEDCEFINSYGGHAVTSIQGAKVVFRYNELTGTDVDMHGYCFEDATSARYNEIYENHFYSRPDDYFDAVNIRGGTGVIYNNYLHKQAGGGFYAEILLQVYRAWRSACYGGCGSVSEGGEGYPLIDQPGRGKNQSAEPIYIWGNQVDTDNDGDMDRDAVVIVSGGNAETSCGGEISSDFIKNTVHGEESVPDYYDDGTTAPGYTAYTYPHPLRGEATCLGDANLSGTITIADVVAVLKHIAETAVLEGQALINADADHDSDVDGDDVTRILQHITGANPLPGCE